MNGPLIPLLWILFISTFMWFVLLHKLFGELRESHPEIYTQLGSPAGFWSISPNTANELMGFLLKKGYAPLGNPKLALICNSMRLSLAIYTLGTLLLLLSFMLA